MPTTNVEENPNVPIEENLDVPIEENLEVPIEENPQTKYFYPLTSSPAPSLPLCQQASETIIHALHDCAVVRPMWTQLGKETSDPLFYGCDLLDWLENNGKANYAPPPNQIPWRHVFLFAIWSIYLAEAKSGGFPRQKVPTSCLLQKL